MERGRSGRRLAAALLLGMGMIGGVGVGGIAAAPLAQIGSAAAAPLLAPCQAGEDEEAEEQERAGNATDADAIEDENGADDAAEGDTDADGDEDANGDEDRAEGNGAEDDDGDGADASAKPGELSAGQDLLPQAKIAVEQAVTVAQTEASGSLGSVELEEKDGRLVFEVTVGEQEVFVDAMDASVVSVEQVQSNGDEDGKGCEDEAEAQPGALDEGQDLLSEAGITLEQAVKTAQGAAQGTLGHVDLERVDGTLVFAVDIGDQDVLVDAATGRVVTANPEAAQE